MKSFLILCFSAALAVTSAVDIIALPPAVVNPEPTVRLAYIAGSMTFQLQWIVADGNPQLSDTAFIGMGFQNGLEANTPNTDVAMYGPWGTDFFILRGPVTTPTVEFRTLGMKTGQTPKGSQPTARESFQTISTIPSGSRVKSFTMASQPTNYTTYTATVACDKGSMGKTNFWNPAAVLFAFGSVSNGNIVGHPATMQGRGWKRTDSSANSNLTMYKLCTGGGINTTAMPMPATTSSGPTLNVLSFMSLLFAAVVALRLI